MVFFDLDGFKQVNDTDGHAAGDARADRGRRRGSAAVRADDFCARFGGDEFVVLCADAEPRMRRASPNASGSRSPQPFAATASRVSASIGVAVVHARLDADADSVLERADAAMYRSKEAGGDRVTVDRRV